MRSTAHKYEELNVYCTPAGGNEQGGYSVRKEEGRETVRENVIKMRDLTAGRQSRRLDAAEGHRGEGEQRARRIGGVRNGGRGESGQREWKGEEGKDIYRRGDKAGCLFPRGAPRLGFLFFQIDVEPQLIVFCLLSATITPSLPPSPPQIELLSACGPEGRMSLRCLCSALIAFIKCENVMWSPCASARARGALRSRIAARRIYDKYVDFLLKFR